MLKLVSLVARNEPLVESLVVRSHIALAQTDKLVRMLNQHHERNQLIVVVVLAVLLLDVDTVAQHLLLQLVQRLRVAGAARNMLQREKAIREAQRTVGYLLHRPIFHAQRKLLCLVDAETAHCILGCTGFGQTNNRRHVLDVLPQLGSGAGWPVFGHENHWY